MDYISTDILPLMCEFLYGERYQVFHFHSLFIVSPIIIEVFFNQSINQSTGDVSLQSPYDAGPVGFSGKASMQAPFPSRVTLVFIIFTFRPAMTLQVEFFNNFY